ncbi:MAG: 1,4-dihydroxy-2-naphthoate synthase, partial [Jatrophihabitans sp.]|nr:1,4-dihydroxy-2-naphthoate synthase [Jatrophihabitans sp.]
MTDAPVLREHVEDGIEIVRLNRPDKRNALDSASLELLNETLDHLAADP